MSGACDDDGIGLTLSEKVGVEVGVGVEEGF